MMKPVKEEAASSPALAACQEIGAETGRNQPNQR
jgi:hypothetical protein